MTIQEIYSLIEKQCNDSIASIVSVNKPEYLVSDELKRIQDFVVKQAFVSVFTEWEHFLENSTIAYALGEASINGRLLTRYIFPTDEDHADRLIKGTSSYPDWSKMEVVEALEITLFESGEPFVTALNGFASKYKEIKKVRNVIVHNSIKSQDEFDTLVRNALNAASVGITPTEFLLSKKNSNPPFFKMYITYILNAAKIISEYDTPTSQ